MSQTEGEVIRRQLLGELHRLSDKYPALRVSQLILNAVPGDALRNLSHDIYYLEDSVLLGYLVAYERDVDQAREKTSHVIGG